MSGRLKAARTMAGLSMDRLASALNVSKAKLVAWERGDRLPAPGDLRALAALYDLYGVHLLSARDRAAVSARPADEQDSARRRRIEAWASHQARRAEGGSGALGSQRCGGCGRWISLSDACRRCARETPATRHGTVNRNSGVYAAFAAAEAAD